MATTRRQVVGAGLVAACTGLLIACSVPGGQSVKTLSDQPAATLTYPTSTLVTTTHDDGTPHWFLGRGTPASVGLNATTTASPAQVLAYYSQALTTAGWTQVFDDPNDNSVPGRTMHNVAWDSAKLVFELVLRTDPSTTTTDYETNFSGSL